MNNPFNFAHLVHCKYLSENPKQDVTNEMHLASCFQPRGHNLFPVMKMERLDFLSLCKSTLTVRGHSDGSNEVCFRDCKHHAVISNEIFYYCTDKLKKKRWMICVLFVLTHLKMALVLSLPHLKPSDLTTTTQKANFSFLQNEQQLKKALFFTNKQISQFTQT